jgi:uncharacterized protein
VDDTNDLGTDRHGLEVLATDVCWDLVAATAIGRVAFVDAGDPVVFPVAHGVHGRSVVFRTGSGSKLGAALMGSALAFEVDGWVRDDREGWSVLVRGIAEPVYDDEATSAFESLGIPAWLPSTSDGTWVRIRADEISGRRLRWR